MTVMTIYNDDTTTQHNSSGTESTNEWILINKRKATNARTRQPSRGPCSLTHRLKMLVENAFNLTRRLFGVLTKTSVLKTYILSLSFSLGIYLFFYLSKSIFFTLLFLSLILLSLFNRLIFWDHCIRTTPKKRTLADFVAHSNCLDGTSHL